MSDFVTCVNGPDECSFWPSLGHAKHPTQILFKALIPCFQSMMHWNARYLFVKPLSSTGLTGILDLLGDAISPSDATVLKDLKLRAKDLL